MLTFAFKLAGEHRYTEDQKSNFDVRSVTKTSLTDFEEYDISCQRPSCINSQLNLSLQHNASS